MATTTTDATAISLAAEQEKRAQEALKRQKEQEDALMKAYQTNSQGIYDTSKTNASNLLTGSKSDIQNLYDQGYTQLQDLTGQQSAANMTDLVRQNENKLQGQGLLGGPSGALNEALANSAAKVRTDQLTQLENYINNKNSALSNMYGSTASQLAGLESAYGTQSQGLQSTALQNALAGTKAGTDITNQYGMTGLEAALGTNKIQVETGAQKDLAANQAALNAEAVAAANATKAAELQTKQDAWDRQYQSIYAELYRTFRAQGQMDASASASAKAQTLNQIGPRP